MLNNPNFDKTLLSCWLQELWFSQPSTGEIRHYTVRELKTCDAWEVGSKLGLFVQRFRIDQPLRWLTDQPFHDRVGVETKQQEEIDECSG